MRAQGIAISCADISIVVGGRPGRGISFLLFRKADIHGPSPISVGGPAAATGQVHFVSICHGPHRRAGRGVAPGLASRYPVSMGRQRGAELRHLRQHAVAVDITCRACGHGKTIPLEDLIAAHGETTHLRELRIYCSQCGSREYRAVSTAEMPPAD